MAKSPETPKTVQPAAEKTAQPAEKPAQPPETPDQSGEGRKFAFDFDSNKLIGDLQDMLKQYKLPGMDVEALVSSQKKNIEAITHANRAVMEGLQTVAKRQAEVLQETMREASKAVASMTHSASPTDLVAKQTEVAKHAFEKGVTTMRELAEIVAKSNKEATQAMNARISATIDEIRSVTQKKK